MATTNRHETQPLAIRQYSRVREASGGGPIGKATRSVLVGYSATGHLLRQAFQRPFGTASAGHGTWIFPQIVMVFALMPLVGALQGHWVWWQAMIATTLLACAGLALTAAVGWAAERGTWKERD